MNKKVLQTLEFTKVVDMLADKATSDPGRILCRQLDPMTDISEINTAQNETYDALGMLISKGSTSFGGNKDISYAVKSLEIGASLSIEELLNIAGLLNNTERIKKYSDPGENVDETKKPYPSIMPYFDELTSLKPVYSEIERCILSVDEIADDASVTLKNIRRSIVHTGEKIHSQLNSMVNGSMKTYLMDSIITQRDGRYCIPVKAEYKSAVKGMVHDQSSTGSTFFIEPEAVVNLNNELRELYIKEKEEIAVILKTLSDMCGEHTEEILTNMKVMTKLDFIFAKANLALSMNATKPVFNTEHRIKIRKGRHPLLDGKKVVPIDIHLGDDFDLLIITGPNTGGKTVSLKTVGLLTLMGQAGLHIPALDRSELSVFTKVFADIGDEQSIEQSLSTFSSHMKNIVTILKFANEDSLCLFDELGAGTDPTEGAALAISILDHLHSRRIRTMATTHYSELKVYALSKERVENACCEFDVETLSPTYRLLIGIPGKSNAFAISRKLGLPDEIIENATKQISVSETSFEDLIADLETKRITIEKDKEDIASYKAKIKELQDNLHAKNEKIDERRENILREANAKARDILEEAKKTADETIRIYNKLGPGTTINDLERERERLREEIDRKNDKLVIKDAPKRKGKEIKPDEIKVGDTVRIVSMGLSGTVNSLPDQKGNLFVMCGSLRTKTTLSNLERINEVVESPKLSSKPKSVSQSKAYSISSEVNLLGLTVDEALAKLDKYLDDAYLAHLSIVRVVHGKGTGALRSAVTGFLKKSPYVKEFRKGEYGEGDSGVTVVTFK